MVRRPFLKTKDVIKQQAEQWNKNVDILFEELEHSPSDRSCVIVSAAYIDDLLEYLIKCFLSSPSNEKEDKELFSGYGPLSSFSSKILLSYRLGLISDYEYRTLQVIRKIRNSFAHDISKDSLLEFKGMLIPIVPVRQLLLIKSIPLSAPDDTADPPLPVVPAVDLSSVRDVFKKIVLCLTNLLSARCLYVVKDERETPSEYKSLVEIDEQRIGMIQYEMEQIERVIQLINESIDVHQQIIKGLSTQSRTKNTAEIKKHRLDIEKLESKKLENYQEYLEADAMLSALKFAQGQIQKAYDKESLS